MSLPPREAWIEITYCWDQDKSNGVASPAGSVD